MAVRAPGNKPVLDASAATANPGTSDILADTGALGPGRYEVRVLVGGDAAGTFQVQRRNAANGANVGDVPIIYTAATSSGEYVLTYVLETGERIRVLPTASLTGNFAATIQVEELN
jgi:hypothetical protein